ncbi:MAG: hypothetical protein NT166_12250 [Candidatus Aminicenantes bacterium]|nr:hypothetical protein [Candidatus Aminicenantes bacterium]
MMNDEEKGVRIQGSGVRKKGMSEPHMTPMSLMTLILPLVFNPRNLRHLRYQRFRQCFNWTIKIPRRGQY